jgi:hypothetical protein
MGGDFWFKTPLPPVSRREVFGSGGRVLIQGFVLVQGRPDQGNLEPKVEGKK